MMNPYGPWICKEEECAWWESYKGKGRCKVMALMDSVTYMIFMANPSRYKKNGEST